MIIIDIVLFLFALFISIVVDVVEVAIAFFLVVFLVIADFIESLFRKK